MSDIKLSIQNTIKDYTDKLTYLAKENDKLVKDVMLLILVDYVYDWSEWMSASEETRLSLRNFRDSVIRNNSSIVNYRTPVNLYYSNVNVPQSLYT